jgi:hypothetical protein
MQKEIDWKAIADEYATGAADVEIAKLLDITINDFYRLEQEQPAFAKFLDKGRTMSQAWWYEKARKGLFTKEFNTALWNFNMKNRFGWADKTDIQDTTNKDPVNLDQAKSQLQAALKRVSQSSPEILSGLNLIKGGKKDE